MLRDLDVGEKRDFPAALTLNREDEVEKIGMFLYPYLRVLISYFSAFAHLVAINSPNRLMQRLLAYLLSLEALDV